MEISAKATLPEIQEAESLCQSLLQEDPNNAKAQNAFGVVLMIQNRLLEAKPYLEKAIQLEPDYAEAHKNLGDLLLNVDQAQEAENAFRKSLEFDPNNPETFAGLGGALINQGRFEEGIESCKKALSLNNSLPEAHFYLGNVYRMQRNFEDAAKHYHAALQALPAFAEALTNLALTFQAQGKYSEALDSFEQAIQNEPELVEAHFNRGFLHLLLGNFEQGWPAYEWRLHKKETLKREFSVPIWDGSPLQGRRILVYAEQGFGDTIQFVRYLPWAKQLGGTVILECQPALVRLMSKAVGIDHLVETGATLPKFDCYISLGSLPYLFESNAQSIPSSVPYLGVDPAIVEKWEKVFAQVSSLRVGICWQSNPRNKFVPHRSATFQDFAELGKKAGMKFFSLQKGPAAEELTKAGAQTVAIDLAPHLNDFAETAAAILNLDLVITVDTAVAHLAGALGKPTWLLLSSEPDWRWQLQGENSVWYPTTRLFRQPNSGDWKSIFLRLAEELAKLNPLQARTRLPIIKNSFRIGNALYAEGKIQAAIEQFRKAVQEQPANSHAHSNLGSLLAKTGELEEATIYCVEALRRNPRLAEAYISLGVITFGLGHFEESEECYRMALAFRPDFAMAHNNLGNTLKVQGKVDEALNEFEKALSIQPDYSEALFNRGSIDLVRGNFQRGWEGYANRVKAKGFPLRQFSQPEWKGENLQGKTIFLHPEQGYGDDIQFIRYAPELKKRGAKVIVECEAPLFRLLETAAGIDQLVLKGQALPDFDFRCSLESLPQNFATTLQNIPATVPYLHVKPDWGKNWEGNFSWDGKLKIGICWQGNPKHVQDRHRSIPLQQFLKLTQTPDVRLYSLQKGFGTQQLEIANGQVVDLASSIQDFADTAAAMNHLDLILCVDTAIAHLAGALGKPVWVLLPVGCDWRWLLNREDSPWYPSMRLLRQSKVGDWDSVFARVQRELSGAFSKS